MPIVKMPDGTQVRFPDEMPREQIRDMIASKFPDVATQAAPKTDRLPAANPAVSEADAYEKVRGNGTLADATDSAMRGIPFSDEITSAIGAPFRAAGDWMSGKGFDVGKAYNEKQAVETELQRRRDERSPVASTVGQIGGSMAVAGPVAKAGYSLLQGAKPTLMSLMGRGAAEGAGYGAVYGAGEGEGLAERGENALTGAIVGGATGGATGALARPGAGKVDTASLPSADDLKNAAQAAYQRADDAGVIYSKDAMKRITDALTGEFTNFGFHPELQSGAKVALNEMNRLSGENATLKGLDTARKLANNAFQPGNKSNNALTGKVVSAIDDLVANPQAGDVLMGDGAGASAAIQEARGLYRQASKLDTVNGLLDRARLNAGSSGSGGNVENASRQQLKRILTSDKMKRGFTSDEQKAVKAAVLGTPGQNVLRLAGKLSPEGNGLALILHLLGGAATGGATFPLAAGGMIAKRGADAMSANSARLVEALIANGGKLPEAALGSGRKAIVDALTRSGAVTAPRYMSQ